MEKHPTHISGLRCVKIFKASYSVGNAFFTTIKRYILIEIVYESLKPSTNRCWSIICKGWIYYVSHFWNFLTFVTIAAK